MPNLKKTKSNDALARYPESSSSRRPTLRRDSAAGETKTGLSYKICRTVLRSVQIFFAIIGFIFCASQNAEILHLMNLLPTMIITSAFSLLLPFVGLFLLSLHYLRLYSNWTIRKMVMVEGISDLVVVFVYWVLVGVLSASIYGQGCVEEGNRDTCNRLKYSVWCTILGALTWTGSLLVDLMTFVKYSKQETKSLESLEMADRASNL